MQRIELKPIVPARPAPSACPECRGRLVVLKIIPGRGGCEYWTMRCTHCGGIHLNIVEHGGAPAV
ncbi:MAG TPA: hypothetical protein VGD96_19285 [Bradyrhizobium sp.]|jgi:hypothetical protein